MIKSRNVQPQLGVHFSSENNGIWRAQLIVQDTAKAKSLAWKAFGQRPIDGWLYGNRQLNAGMDYSIIWTLLFKLPLWLCVRIKLDKVIGHKFFIIL